MSIRTQLNGLLDDYEQELRANMEMELEMRLERAYERLRHLERCEQLLHDIGIDPDGYYGLLDRQMIRDRLAGLEVSGVVAS